jgi:hypothetical protein
MSGSFDQLRASFRSTRIVLVRILPGGFRAKDTLLTELTGRITRLRLLRKRFDKGTLVCDSTDGIEARNGTLCDACRHPRCRPWLRIWLGTDQATYVLDLAVVSAGNLLALEEIARHRGEDLHELTLTLSVVDHGSWGEVMFEPA